MVKIKRVTLLVLFCIVCVIGCQSNASKSDKTEIIQVNDTVARVEETSALENNSIQQSPNEVVEQVKLLIPTYYRKESQGYPQGLDTDNWYELSRDSVSGKWFTTKADFTLTYTFDDCVGEDALLIGSKTKQSAVFFTDFAQRSLEPTTLAQSISLLPGQRYSIETSQGQYILEASGVVMDYQGEQYPSEFIENQDPMTWLNNNITDYSLTLILPNKETVVLFQAQQIESILPYVIWAGDINQDKGLDLLINATDFYESDNYLLFLSQKVKEDYTIKLVGEIRVTNDC
ncbi:hypothetical protein ACYSNM_03715 [Myroides sp. LJL116]